MLTSRIFWIFILLFLLLPPIPLLLEYFVRLHYRTVTLNGRGILTMLDFFFYYVFFIGAGLAVFMPLSLSRLRMAIGDKLSSNKRTFLRNLLLFATVSILWICCCIFAYMVSTGILIPICAATRIDPSWTVFPSRFFGSLLVSFFHIFSFVALFLLVSTLCTKKLPAILINVFLFGASICLYVPFHRQLVFVEGTTFTPAMKERAALFAFLERLNPGSLSVLVANQAVYTTQTLLKMLSSSLLFTLPILLLAFLAAHMKDVSAQRN